MALLVAPLLFVAAILFVASPFLTDTRQASVRERKAVERERLLKKRDDILSNLKDIEMDFQMGKLSPSDYDGLKSEYESRAVSVFQEMEAVGLDPRAESTGREN